ncbi:hypothetical protein [Kitasatospora sp. NPDC091207]|uniref:hypothetical protein n=1 Tax=Kitasatospora sp. NPDC091207 TaxID=3364083 RepID=UPI0037F33B0D
MRNRVPDPRDRRRWRRRLPALALVWAVVAALAVVPIGLGTVPEARAASSKTVPGPKIWLPKPDGTGSYGAEGSITVSQTQSLSDQVLQVSWSGFTPSVSRYGGPATSVQPGSDGVLYPVRIYQCRGTDPKVTDCYGSTLYGGDPALGFDQKRPAEGKTAPDLPSNMAIAVTGADGSGTAAIEVWSSKLSPSLGCDATHPCSIVVEPNYGGDPLDLYQMRDGSPDCNEHMIDNDGFYYSASDVVLDRYENWLTEAHAGEMCAWNNHIAIPISFAATPDDCNMQNPDVVASGLEMAGRAMKQWITGLCLGQSPLSVQYTSGGGEPQARDSFLAGTRVDVGLTALPDRDTPRRPYVYSPLASTGISVAYLVDDPTTGRQIRDMRLNARLVAKMLTQSYRSPGTRVMPSVDGNPTCVFSDPEFLQLNPLSAASGLHWPGCSSGPEQSLPIVLGTATDLTYQLTTWIANDPDAARFLEGERDQWGTRVNSHYLRPDFQGFPIDQLVRQDDSGVAPNPGEELPEHLKHWKQYEWNPLQTGLSQVLRYLQQGQVTGRLPTPETDGSHKAIGPQPVGQRTLFAILDSGQAKAYSLPEASLQNAAGTFVSPNLTGFQAAVADMPVDATTGTQLLPYGQPDTAYSRDQRAYPLTLVQYAMVPTGKVPAAKAASIGRFLKTVTDTGQLYGPEPGRLPEGFLALTKDQRAQAQDALLHVTAQDGKLPGNQKAPAEPGGEQPGGDPGTPGDPGTTPAGGSDGGTGVTGTAGGTGSTGGDTTPVTAGGTGGGTGGLGTTSGSGGTGSTGSTGTGTGTTGAPAATTPGQPTAKPTASPTAGPLAAAPVAAGTPVPDRSGGARLLLPIALIAGLVLLVGGPAALFLGGTAAGARVTGALRGGWTRLRGRF